VCGDGERIVDLRDINVAAGTAVTDPIAVARLEPEVRADAG
jgi:hypothetical protein